MFCHIPFTSPFNICKDTSFIEDKGFKNLAAKLSNVTCGSRASIPWTIALNSMKDKKIVIRLSLNHQPMPFTALPPIAFDNACICAILNT